MRWKMTLNSVLKEHNQKAADGHKTISFSTQQARRKTLEKGFVELRRLGYKLPDVRGFKERHMTALGHAWEAQKLSPATIQNRISIFRTFSEWIGKRGMIRDAIHYMKDPASVTRQFVAKTDKTWSAQQKDLKDKLTDLYQHDPYVAIQLELQRAFGLRMKEAALLKPHQADRSNYLAVNWGTKGGRERVIPIETAYQKEVLARAKAFAKPDYSLTPKRYSFSQWRDHYYYICQEHGINRKEGITSHGLRHERLNEIYTQITGHLSPVKGGNANLSENQRALDKIARQEVAEVAGHSRSCIAKAYLGKNS